MDLQSPRRAPLPRAELQERHGHQRRLPRQQRLHHGFGKRLDPHGADSDRGTDSVFAFMNLMKTVLVLAALAFSAAINAFPNKPVRIIVAFPAGARTDILARIVGEKLSESGGQPVVVDNPAGASGAIHTPAAPRPQPHRPPP